MSRAKHAVPSKARKKRILKQAKGYYGRRKNVWTVAKNAVERAQQYAYRDRRVRKRDFRKLWIVRINAAARQEGYSYSTLISFFKRANIEINRKIIAYLAMNDITAFKAIVEAAKKRAEDIRVA